MGKPNSNVRRELRRRLGFEADAGAGEAWRGGKRERAAQGGKRNSAEHGEPTEG
jgi:hypothetical protein